MENPFSLKRQSNPLVVDDIKENTTFYYSNFKLIPDESELLFASYISFKNNLQGFLGSDWENYAKQTIKNKSDENSKSLESRELYTTALEVWLELRKESNSSAKKEKKAEKKDCLEMNNDNSDEKKDQTTTKENEDMEISMDKNDIQAKKEHIEEEKSSSDGSKQKLEIVEDNSEDMKGFEIFQMKLREKFADKEINEALFRAIIHAFYTSAWKVWETTLAAYSSNSNNESFSFIQESKRFLLNKLQTVYKTKFKSIRPILVVTEKIKDFLYNDKSKTIILEQPHFLNESDQKNMTNFSSSLKIEHSSDIDMSETLSGSRGDEDNDLKKSFNNLKIAPKETTSLLGKRTSDQAYSVVEVKKVNKKLENKLNQNMIEFAAHYVNNMTRASNTDWQISKTFVTSMVEINYNKLLQAQQRLTTKADELDSEIRIRFIQPAQEFYKHLLEIWILFKTRSVSKEILFTEYLDKVKDQLGNMWNEKFMAPTQNFFMTLYYEWHHIKQVENNSEEKVLLFIKKVKESMSKIWDDNIVKKAEELTGK